MGNKINSSAALYSITLMKQDRRTNGTTPDNASTSGEWNLQGGPKIGTFLYALTLANINRFSKLFHYQNQEKKL